MTWRGLATTQLFTQVSSVCPGLLLSRHFWFYHLSTNSCSQERNLGGWWAFNKAGHSYHHSMTVIRLTKINSLGLESEDNILLKTYFCIIWILSLLHPILMLLPRLFYEALPKIPIWDDILSNIFQLSSKLIFLSELRAQQTMFLGKTKSLLFVDNGKWSQRRNWLCTG